MLPERSATPRKPKTSRMHAGAGRAATLHIKKPASKMEAGFLQNRKQDRLCADLEAGEAANHHVLAHLSNLLSDEFLNSLIRVLDISLLE